MTVTERIPVRRPLRVMLVDDSATELYLLKKVFALAADMEVVASAENGRDALDLLPQVQPDLVCTDYHMPVMDGLEFILRAMRVHPCTILVMSAAVQSFHKENIFQMLSAGAVDVLAKPLGHAGGISAAEAQRFLEKVRAIAQSPAPRRGLTTPAPATSGLAASPLLSASGSRASGLAEVRRPGSGAGPVVTPQPPSPQPSPARGEGARESAAGAAEAFPGREGSERMRPVPGLGQGQGQCPAQGLNQGLSQGLNQVLSQGLSQGRVELVALGASTGGPQVLQVLLSQLPAHFGLPLVCVQHISEGFLEGMVSWLGSGAKLRVEMARAGLSPVPGHVYFAPDGYHLTLDQRRCFALAPCTGQDLHCPGVDPFFLSVARVYGPAALGILLTGMGRDGARGLKAMREAGATTICQDESTSVIFGMPAAAIALGAARYVLPTDGIAAMILRLGDQGLRAMEAPGARD